MTSVGGALVWSPKPFTAGDIDGEGAKRLLGQPDVDLANLLVRETAQNSWDARLTSRVPDFELRLRTLQGEALTTLRTQILPGEATGLGLRDVLENDQVRVLEIVDRGTKGLGGPTRNDVRTKQGPTDWVDFVLSVGSPRDTHLGGGTYGFGKTASYMASSCGTIVIWTQTPHGQGLQQRIIGSAIGPSFTNEERRFTGRHWWAAGVEPNDDWGGDSVQPMTGPAAKQLAERVFSRHFGVGETGTSLLIIDPVGDGRPSKMVEAWRRAIVRNLWPKIIPGQPAGRSMNISLFHENSLVHLVTEDEEGPFKDKSAVLTAIRSVQDGEPNDPSGRVLIHEIRCFNPKRLVGHLGLMRSLFPPPDQAGAGSSRVTLMRHQAELVVKTDFALSADDRHAWVGVFKPVEAVDDAFARSEPAAHDQWAWQGMPQTHERTFVRVALRRIKEVVNDFVHPPRSVGDTTRQASTGVLANTLAALVGASTGGRVIPGSGPRQGQPRKRHIKPKVTVISVQPLSRSFIERERGVQVVQIRLGVEGGKSPLRIKPRKLAVATEGESDASDSVKVVSWERAGHHTIGESIVALPGEEVCVSVEFPAGLAVDCDFTCEVVSR